MLGSIRMLFEPILDRAPAAILSPIVGAWEAAFPVLIKNRNPLELARVGVHKGLVAAVMAGDRATTGRLHPAYALAAAGVLALDAVANAAAAGGPVADLAAAPATG